MSSFLSCDYCSVFNILFQCSRCKSVSYCNAKCQTRAWPQHKILCKAICQEMNKPTPNKNVLKQLTISTKRGIIEDYARQLKLTSYVQGDNVHFVAKKDGKVVISSYSDEAKSLFVSLLHLKTTLLSIEFLKEDIHSFGHAEFSERFDRFLERYNMDYITRTHIFIFIDKSVYQNENVSIITGFSMANEYKTKLNHAINHGVWFLDLLFIRPKFQSRGLGTRYFDDLVTSIKSLSIYPLETITLFSLNKLFSFWIKLGFRNVDSAGLAQLATFFSIDETNSLNWFQKSYS